MLLFGFSDLHLEVRELKDAEPSDCSRLGACVHDEPCASLCEMLLHIKSYYFYIMFQISHLKHMWTDGDKDKKSVKSGMTNCENVIVERNPWKDIVNDS